MICKRRTNLVILFYLLIAIFFILHSSSASECSRCVGPQMDDTQ